MPPNSSLANKMAASSRAGIFSDAASAALLRVLVLVRKSVLLPRSARVLSKCPIFLKYVELFLISSADKFVLASGWGRCPRILIEGSNFRLRISRDISYSIASIFLSVARAIWRCAKIELEKSLMVLAAGPVAVAGSSLTGCFCAEDALLLPFFLPNIEKITAIFLGYKKKAKESGAFWRSHRLPFE